jgi:outer membrane protein, multidrug efflux system
MPFSRPQSDFPLITRRSFYALVISLSLLTITACRPTAPVPQSGAAALPKSYASTANSSTVADTLSVATTPWQQFFGDPALVALLDTAIRQNPDLQIALQRVAVAQAELTARRGALLPTVSAVASTSVDRYSDWSMTGVGNLDLNRSTNIEPNTRFFCRPALNVGN